MEKILLSELKKLSNNPRTIKTEDMEKLKASIKKFWVIEGRPFLVSTRTGENVIIGWNMRYEACKALWIEEVPVHIFDNLTEEEEREIIIRDNVSNGEWDMEALANEWDVKDLNEWGVDIEIPKTLEEEKEEIEDNVPELEQEIIYVQKGDIFQLGSHKLMCGDSMDDEYIQKLTEWITWITHCISDPPYWIAYDNSKKGWHWMIKNDDKILDYTQLANKYTNWYFCMWTWYQVVDDWSKLIKNTFWKLTNMIIWHKWGWGMWDTERNLIQDFEILLVSNRWNKLATDYRWNSTWYFQKEEKEEFLKTAKKEQLKCILENEIKWKCIWKVWKDNGVEYMHPTQKPVEINQRVLETYVNQWENVLDLFWWSWSNLIACEKTNRKCYMMELDEKYIQVIIKRFYEYTDWKVEIKCTNRQLDISLIINT